MIISMTDEQAKQLGQFLIVRHAQMEADLKRTYYWWEMADFIGISEELLIKLKEGTHPGINGKTATKLGAAFGEDVLRMIGLLPQAQPTFTLQNVSSFKPKRRRKPKAEQGD